MDSIITPVVVVGAVIVAASTDSTAFVAVLEWSKGRRKKRWFWL